MSDPIPSELSRQLGDDTWLGSCDWGYCRREQAGWAQSDSDASEEWMPICAECARGDFPAENDEPYPVDRYISIDEVTAAMGWSP